MMYTLSLSLRITSSFIKAAALKLLTCAPLLFNFSFALTFELPSGSSNVVGKVFTIYVEPGDTFEKIAREYDMGYAEIVRANQHLNPYKPKPWSKLVIPNAFILPNAPREGIVINIPEMRLYYYPTDADIVLTFPIGVGRQDWLTPTATTKIIEKKIDPEWLVPESIREYMAEKGVELPEIMPAGPENPLGDYALRLNLNGYLIHGTNRPSSIGRRSSSGCIRLFPEDIEELFLEVSRGDPVYLVNQPFKAGWYEDELYIESHRPFWDQLPNNAQNSTMSSVLIRTIQNRSVTIDWPKIDILNKRFVGYPQFITRGF